MVLVCNVCHPKKGDWQYHQKGVLAIAKWYPGNNGGGNYYRNDDGEGMGKEFTDFLVEHEHAELPSEHYTQGAGQENPIRLEYESEGLPITPPQNKLLKVVKEKK